MTSTRELTVEELLEENAALTRALTGLTRGGSEFFIRKRDRYVADIDACVEWVNRVRRDAHRRTLDAIFARQEAEKRAAAMVEALKAVKDWDDFVPTLPRNVLALIDAALAKALPTQAEES